LLALDFHVINFDGNYYGTTKGTVKEFLSLYASDPESLGRKKLEEVERDLRTQSTIRHSNLLSVYAVKLTLGQPARIAILMEQRSGMSMRDLLQTGSSLNLQKATVSFLIANN
jgi:hypothetical protein